MRKIIPVLLCGGLGKRLWPISGSNLPKQFIKIFSGKSPLQITMERIQNKNLFEEPLLISNISYLYIIKKQLKEISTGFKYIILEPEGKNTAPSVTLASIILSQSEKYRDSNILILPADHYIKEKDITDFEKDIATAAKDSISDNHIILFGIKPEKPEVNYGYIKTGKVLANQIYEVSDFTEKPSLEKAEEYQNNKDFLWNSGILLTKNSYYTEQIKKFYPDIFKYCNLALGNKVVKDNIYYADAENFSKCQDISLDYSVLEKSKELLCIKSKIFWSDIGSWHLLRAFTDSEHDLLLKIINYIDNFYDIDNYLASITKIDNFFNNFFKYEINEIIKIINTGLLNISNFETDYRNWGNYKVLYEAKHYKIKILSVEKNKKISLQKHLYRSEYWKIIKGNALCYLEGKNLLLSANDSIYIPKNKLHYVKNSGKEELTIIEIQVGKYTKESDIVRPKKHYIKKSSNKKQPELQIV